MDILTKSKNIGRSMLEKNSSSSPLAPEPDELAIFEANSLDMRCIAGFDGYFKWLDSGWSDTLGWTHDELLNTPFKEFVHSDDIIATESEMVDLIKGGNSVHFENRYCCRDGRYKPLEWDAISLPERGRVYAVARDITYRRGLEKEILQASDREKDRMGRDLHDGLCQNLAGIAALSASLARNLESLPEAAVARKIKDLLNETVGQARDIARGLNPVILEDSELGDSLCALASNIEALFRVECRFHESESHLTPLALETKLQLYRIAQEAVSNAINHGRSHRIDIGLEVRNHQGVLTISDNGVGTPEDCQSTAMGVGLRTMDYRARLIGGSLRFEPHLPRGILVSCIFPVNRAGEQVDR